LVTTIKLSLLRCRADATFGARSRACRVFRLVAGRYRRASIFPATSLAALCASLHAIDCRGVEDCVLKKYCRWGRLRLSRIVPSTPCYIKRLCALAMTLPYSLADSSPCGCGSPTRSAWRSTFSRMLSTLFFLSRPTRANTSHASWGVALIHQPPCASCSSAIIVELFFSLRFRDRMMLLYMLLACTFVGCPPAALAQLWLPSSQGELIWAR